jgi:hypothetical protein
VARREAESIRRRLTTRLEYVVGEYHKGLHSNDEALIHSNLIGPDISYYRYPKIDEPDIYIAVSLENDTVVATSQLKGNQKTIRYRVEADSDGTLMWMLGDTAADGASSLDQIDVTFDDMLRDFLRQC